MASSSRPGRQHQQQQEQDLEATLSPELCEELDFYLSSRLDHISWLSVADQRRIKQFTAQVQRDPAIKSAVAQRLADLASPVIVDENDENEAHVSTNNYDHDENLLDLDFDPDLDHDGSDDIFSLKAPSSLGRAEEKVHTLSRIAQRKAATWREYQNALAEGGNGGGGSSAFRDQHEPLDSREEYDMVVDMMQGRNEGGEWHEGAAEGSDRGEQDESESGYYYGNYTLKGKEAQGQGQGQQGYKQGRQQGRRRERREQGRFRHEQQQQREPSQQANANANGITNSDPANNNDDDSSPKSVQEAVSLYEEATARWRHHMKAAVQAEADASRASFLAVLLTTAGNGEDAEPGRQDDNYDLSSSPIHLASKGIDMGMGRECVVEKVREEQPIINSRSLSFPSPSPSLPRPLRPPPAATTTASPAGRRMDRGGGRGGGRGRGLAVGTSRLNPLPTSNFVSQQRQQQQQQQHDLGSRSVPDSRPSFSSISQQQQQAALQGLGLVPAVLNPTTPDTRRRMSPR